MVALHVFVSSLLLASSVVAAPSLRYPPASSSKALLCRIPLIDKFLCSRAVSAKLTVKTLLGTAIGTTDPATGAKRFSAKYASAGRWQESTIVNNWQLPNSAVDGTTLPLACPQPDLDSAEISEDCLSLLIYVPPAVPIAGVPVLVWFPGGSFVVGSASGAGLDGSKLATATKSLVVIVQHRLGAFGFLSPDGKTNLAVQDSINALKFLKTVLPSFGGLPANITIAGQSSGATMVRALLAAPSATSLFKSAILQSDPIDYGFLSAATHTTLLNSFRGLIACGADARCSSATSAPISSIIDAQTTVYRTANSLDPASGTGEPIRPVRDSLVIVAPNPSGAFPSNSKPILLSSVKDEGGPAIYGGLRDPVGKEWFTGMCYDALGPERAEIAFASPYYPVADDTPDSRPQIKGIATDYIWKCSSWTFARNWVSNGGKAYVAQYTLGATYVSNVDIPFCKAAGSVCHEDDIQIVFGTVQNPTAAQSALITQVQARYKAFLYNGNPNGAGLSNWKPATATNVNALNFGGDGPVDVGACTPEFWGSAIEYDYQYYH